jgi:hypothetical protein
LYLLDGRPDEPIKFMNDLSITELISMGRALKVCRHFPDGKPIFRCGPYAGTNIMEALAQASALYEKNLTVAAIPKI